MKNEQNEMQIPMQVGSELRIRQDGSVVVDNPELELARNPEAADAVLSYRFDAAQGLHIFAADGAGGGSPAHESASPRRLSFC